MTHIAINDLNENKALDNQALAKIRGGFSWGYQQGVKNWFGPVNSSIKELTNINTQLNIAVLSQGVFQNNSNFVSQA
ncbi:hypothetical protein [Marinobacterium rhizophilum]|uniref:hypothetical protein n=1 Tax=Marinobacterium rhizophilum TaxID=420402 RepID=UPI000361E56A|nr:hypothetical protein [Marinobacterium rhizophilum]